MIVVSENTKRNYYNAANYKLEESYAAFEILSSTLYSNKIGAVVRELLSNAIDSHNRSRKKDIPVEIGVEERTDGDIFYVEDFGLGLTEDEATYLFSTYFATTKGDENESIGGFGLGSGK
jgi:HSP90 family molecular chaperone